MRSGGAQNVGCGGRIAPEESTARLQHQPLGMVSKRMWIGGRLHLQREPASWVCERACLSSNSDEIRQRSSVSCGRRMTTPEGSSARRFCAW